MVVFPYQTLRYLCGALLSARLSMLVNLLTLVGAAAAVSSDSCSVEYSDRFDCGQDGTNEEECVAKGCCWSPVTATATARASGGTPWCFYEKGVTPPTSAPTPEPTTCFALADDSSEAPFSASEVSKFRKFFMANINIDGNGGVVAAPDQSTPGGSYYYHWKKLLHL